MIHRLALLMGGTGAAGVVAAALVVGGFGAPLANNPAAFAPGANNALAGGQVAPPTPTDQPTAATSLGGGPKHTTRKGTNTVYVRPAPAAGVHSGRPARNANAPTDTPRPSRNDNNGGNQSGDNNGGNQAGSNQGGHEPGGD